MGICLFHCFTMFHHDPVLKHLIWDLFGQMLHFWHLLNLASETEELIEVLDDSERQPPPPKKYLGHTNMKNSIEPGVYHIYIYIYYIYILFTYLKYNTFSAFYSRCKGLKRYQFFIAPIFRLPVISPPTSSPAPNEAWGGWHPAPLARREGTTENTEHREPILYINNIYIYIRICSFILYIYLSFENIWSRS